MVPLINAAVNGFVENRVHMKFNDARWNCRVVERRYEFSLKA